MRAIVVLLFLFNYTSLLLAQQQPVQLLDRIVSVDVTNKTISETLAAIGQQTGIKFSYSPAIIGGDRKVTLLLKNKPLRVVLERLLGDQIQFKAKHNFVIITPKPAAEKKEQKEMVVSGYVYNQDGDGVAYASLYSKAWSVSAVTNASGYFKITCPTTKSTSTLSVSKTNYRDTVVVVSSTKNKIEITLQPKPKVSPKPIVITSNINHDSIPKVDSVFTQQVEESSPTNKDTTHLSGLKKWFLSPETQANIKNISDTLFSKVQFSFLPQLSTNKLLVGNTVNAVSISALVGYNKAVEVASVAGIMNVIDEKAGYVNVGGVANVIGDSMVGAEVAGVVNLNDGYVGGAQIAGVANLNKQATHGVQVAGVLNSTPQQVIGAQIAGVANWAKQGVDGIQIAGVTNVLDGEMRGPQIAGIININKGNVYGAQVGGVINIAKGDTVMNQVAGVINIADGNVQGGQVAGVVNVASGEVKGAQVSGVLNVANEIYGAQVGLINLSKTIHGVPVGLISISKNGYHKLELFGDESMYTQLAFRTGALAFHNIFTAGVDLTNRVDGLWSFGYGIGSFYKIPRKWHMGFEVLSQACLTNSLSTNAVWLYGFNYLFEKQFTPKFSVGFGPTFKLMHNPNSSSTIADVVSPYQFNSYSFKDGGELKFWAGMKISIKIF